jgi:hypothetical protein
VKSAPTVGCLREITTYSYDPGNPDYPITKGPTTVYWWNPVGPIAKTQTTVYYKNRDVAGGGTVTGDDR